MAEWLFNQKVNHRGLSGYLCAESAGISAVDGFPPSEQTIQVIADQGGDLSSHKSQPVTTDLISQFDVILTMTREQEQYIKEDYTQSIKSGDGSLAYGKKNIMGESNGSVPDSPQLFLLADYANKAQRELVSSNSYNYFVYEDAADIEEINDVKDPIGGSYRDYKFVFSQLDQLTEIVVAYLEYTIER